MSDLDTIQDSPFGGKYDGQGTFDAQQDAKLGQVAEDPTLEMFRTEMADKMALGDEKYGQGSWARHDQLAEAMNELVDLGNYAFLKWRQLKALQDRLDSLGVPRSLTGEDRLGVVTDNLSQHPDAHAHTADPYAVCVECRELSRQ